MTRSSRRYALSALVTSTKLALTLICWNAQAPVPNIRNQLYLQPRTATTVFSPKNKKTFNVGAGADLSRTRSEFDYILPSQSSLPALDKAVVARTANLIRKSALHDPRVGWHGDMRREDRHAVMHGRIA